MKSIILITILLLLSLFTSYSQNYINGNVFEIVDGIRLPLPFANVIVKETISGTATDIDGNFSIPLENGLFHVTFSFVGYLAVEKEIKIDSENLALDIELKPDGYQLDEVKVVAKMNRENESTLMMEQKKAVVATQTIGAQELSRKGISDAEAAVTNISGISKQDGVKNVFVRGLGDRYNYTTLNGFSIPSEDPEYKNISLDFFGSDIIKNIEVNKVFSADNYSDVGGAVINISSKELVKDKEFSLDFSSGFNTKTTNADFLQMDGVNFWGNSTDIQPGANYKTDYNFGNSLDPHSPNIPLNSGYGFSLGKSFTIGKNKNPLTTYLVSSYSSSYSYTQEKIYDNTNIGDTIQDFDGNKSSQKINQLVLGNANLLLNNKHEFNYNFVLIHDNSQYVGQYTGINPDFESSLQPAKYYQQGFLMRQQSNDNLLLVNQLLGSFKLNERSTLDAGLTYNFVKGIEPDRRITQLYRRSETDYQFRAGDGSHVRNSSDLIENDLNWKFKLIYRLPKKFDDDKSALNVGYNGRYVTDDFNATEYSYTPLVGLHGVQALDTLSFDYWYNQANYSVGNNFAGAARMSTYNVTKILNSAFTSIDYQFNPKFTVNAGVRFDMVNIHVDYKVEGGYNGDGTAVLNPIYILPSLNLKYAITSKQTLRLGLSKSYTLPQSKEISPYQYLGLSFRSQGNQDLKPSDNYNADLKWDFYLSSSELLTVTTFYKYIKNPIARAYEASAGSYFTYDNVSDHAVASGIEIEMRKNIFASQIGDQGMQNKLSAGLNASYIYSNMLVDVFGSAQKESQLEGAAPVILNVDLTYNYSFKDISFTNSLVLNYFSERIYTIGLAGFEDVVEKGIPTLNFVSITELNKHLSIKLKAKNILDPQYQLTRKVSNGDQINVLNSYYKGIDLSVGITYKF